MFDKALWCALLSAAIIPGAALAHPGGGSGPPAGVGGMGNAGGFGPGGAGGLGNGALGGLNGLGSSMRDEARMNSQGPANASANAIAHANQNSVLAGTSSTRAVTSGALAGLTTGTTLYSNGTAVGTVQQIRTSGRGSVAMVVVKGTNGGYYAVPANKLAYSGGMLSTTARLAGINPATTGIMAANRGRGYSQAPIHASPIAIAHANRHSVLYGASAASSTRIAANSRARSNSQGPLHASATGIAHANPHSVLYGSSATSLTGVSVGMPLYSNGTKVGTVYRVVTANGVITRVLVQGTNGRIYSLSPRTLTASGGTVSTTTSLRGI